MYKLLLLGYVCVQAPASRICLCTSSYLYDMSVYKLLPQGYVCVQAPAGQVDRQSSGAACLPSVLAPASSAARAMMAMSKQENRQSVNQYGTVKESRKARIEERNFMFRSAGCSHLRAEGFSCTGSS